MKHISAVMGVIAASVFTLSVAAQEPATIVLRDGQRLSGEVVALGVSGVTLRSNGQDRAYPAETVVAIEYVAGKPSAEAAAKLKSGTPVVVLRNGQIVEGKLTAISAAVPRKLTVHTAGGPREFSTADVAQVYFHGQPTAANLAPGDIAFVVEAGQTLGGIAVPAKDPWTQTVVRVTKGEQIRFSATGDILVAANASTQIEGSRTATVATAKYPVPTAPVGALIGRIDDGQPFVIGGVTQPMTMPATGQLFLGINDDQFADNSGRFMVMVAK